MKKIMITGISGFVGRHFLNFLYESSITMNVCGLDVNNVTYDISEYQKSFPLHIYQVNLLNKDALEKIISDFRPDYLLHLASFSSVAHSWKYPAESFQNNTQIFLNIIEALIKYNRDCRILSIGSSEEYGNYPESAMPLTEDMALHPINPYAAARMSQEILSNIFVNSYGMNLIMTRSFNHIGPFQDNRFVVPSFVDRILTIKKSGKKEGTIETGDLTIIRDFVDVRDVVRAYYSLLTDGKNGEIYNICSGKGIALSEIVEKIAEICDVKIICQPNPDYIKPNDNRITVGAYQKIQKHIGWNPTIPLDTTLRDMIEYKEMITG